MLGRTSAMAAESYARGPIAAEEFEALPEALDSMVAAMRLQPEAAVVEIPYSGTEPSWIDRVNVMKDDPALMEDDAVIPGFEDFPETALLMVDGSAVHPVLGPGCLLHLVLPLHDPGGRCLAKVAAREWTSFARCHTIGGWYDRDGTPAHVAFVPSVAFYPGMLVSLVWNEIVRTGFARSVI